MGCWKGRDILSMMVRMKKLAVEEKRIPVASLLNFYINTNCEEDCPVMKDVNRAREVVLYRVNEIPLLADAFAKHIKDVGETVSILRKTIEA